MRLSLRAFASVLPILAALPSSAAITFVTEAVWKAANPGYGTLSFQGLTPGENVGYSYGYRFNLSSYRADADPRYADGHGARAAGGGGGLTLVDVTAFAGIVPAGNYAVNAYSDADPQGAVAFPTGPFYVLSNAPITAISYQPRPGQTATTSADFDDILYAPVPEPAPLAALGLGGLALVRRRRAR